MLKMTIGIFFAAALSTAAAAGAPNLAFSPEEDKVYIAAIDDISAAPWPGKVYEVPLR